MRAIEPNRHRQSLRVPGTRPPLRRLVWTLSQLKAGHRLKATELARRFEISLRTAYRDIEFLRDQYAAPLEFDHRERTYRLTAPTYSLPLVPMTRGELFALFFAEKVVRQYRGTPFESDLVSALRKMVELLPEEVQVVPSTLEGFLAVDLGPVAMPDAEIFREVVDALSRRRRIVMRYSSHTSGQTLDRKVDPYRVYNLRGDWYLAAWDHLRREVRDFALHRLRAVRTLDEAYEVDPRFRFEDYMRGAFNIEKGTRPVRVAVRFSSKQARWIRERRWHPTARIRERRDGACVLTMKVGGLGEVRRWVMQFGPHAEVLGPRKLRQEIQQELSEALQNYNRSGQTRGRPPDRRWQGS